MACWMTLSVRYQRHSINIWIKTKRTYDECCFFSFFCWKNTHMAGECWTYSKVSPTGMNLWRDEIAHCWFLPSAPPSAQELYDLRLLTLYPTHGHGNQFFGEKGVADGFINVGSWWTALGFRRWNQYSKGFMREWCDTTYTGDFVDSRSFVVAGEL